MFRAQKQHNKPKVQSVQLRAQVDSEIEIRTETLFGREYTVVPVIAMVEGVRFGANADEPELGLASEFGADLITWANRPLVLNHPQCEIEGEMVYCSANSPEILESYAFGMTMNPYVEDAKLKMEAWIDNVRVEELGGEFSEIVEAITSQEMVEVSVGFFSALEVKKGTFRGQKYGGIWRNIKPDHLAILSIGTLGACSNADGCGIPRINQEAAMSKTNTIKTDKPAVQDCGCGCGGTCADKHNHDHEEPAVNSLEESTSTEVVEGSEEELQAHLADEADRTEVRSFNAKLIAQSIEGTLTDNDVRNLLRTALRKKFSSSDVYLYAFTQDKAIIETYSYCDGCYGYRTYQIGINVTESGVEFVGEAEEVVLLTKIVSAGSPTDTITTVQSKENDMTEVKTPVPDNAAASQQAETTQASAPVAQAVQQPLTAQQYVDQAPAEVREMLQASMKLHADRKNGLIDKLKANASNKFSEEQLKAFDLGMLENLAALAGETVIPNYGGVAAPVQPTVHSQVEAIPAPPRLFATKPANAA